MAVSRLNRASETLMPASAAGGTSPVGSGTVGRLAVGGGTLSGVQDAISMASATLFALRIGRVSWNMREHSEEMRPGDDRARGAANAGEASTPAANWEERRLVDPINVWLLSSPGDPTPDAAARPMRGDGPRQCRMTEATGDR